MLISNSGHAECDFGTHECNFGSHDWKKKWKKNYGAEFKIFHRFSHLTSTATLFKYMIFSRNGNKQSSIESKNKGIGR
jgi:hypothetical protein